MILKYQEDVDRVRGDIAKALVERSQHVPEVERALAHPDPEPAWLAANLLEFRENSARPG